MIIRAFPITDDCLKRGANYMFIPNPILCLSNLRHKDIDLLALRV